MTSLNAAATRRWGSCGMPQGRLPPRAPCEVRGLGCQATAVSASNPSLKMTLRRPAQHTPFRRGVGGPSVPRLTHCRSAGATTGTLPHLSGEVLAGVSSVLQPVLSFFNPTILAATGEATLKLFVMIGIVGWMLRTGRLPEDTAPVLSQVSFNLIIPCMLMTKVAVTLVEYADPRLFFIPVMATLQIMVGALLGWLASTFVHSPRTVRQDAIAYSNMPHAAIAASTAAAIGNPAAATALMSTPVQVPEGLKQLTALACAFGNSSTLPLVFLLTLLPASGIERAAGYTALFLMGWSPTFWSIGFSLLKTVRKPTEKQKPRPIERWKLDAEFSRTALNVVDCGVDDAIDITPSSQVDPAVQAMPLSLPGPPPRNFQDDVSASMASKRRSWTQPTWFNKAASSALKVATQIINPPIVAILIGVLIGVTPLGPLLAQPGGEYATKMMMQLPFELQCILTCMQATFSSLTLIGSAVVAVQAIVLGSSMFKKQQSAALQPGEFDQASGSKSLFSLLMPSCKYERRALVATGVVRLLIMPFVGLALTAWFINAQLLPQDHICHLAILVQSAMPPAQNLVLMLQLRDETKHLAPKMAQMLLRIYPMAIIPLTLWITVFVALLDPTGVGAMLKA